MGLFSNQIKTYVDSTIYNLAGDTALAPDVVKTTVLGAALKSSEQGIGKVLMETFLSGSGMNQRRFFSWASNYYTLGMPSALVDGARTVNPANVALGLAEYVSPLSEGSLRVLKAIIDTADVDYWAEYWVRVNHPTLDPEEWSAFLDTATNEMVISLPSNITARIAADANLIWGTDRPDNRKVLFISYTILSRDPETGEDTESAPALFTYQMGSGSAIFDALAQSATTLSEFFPAIPLRIDNVSVRDLGDASIYEAARKAYRKLTKQNIDGLLDTIEANESIDEIDYVFLAQGIPLNTIDNRCREYLYKFFKELIGYELNTYGDYVAYANAQLDQSASEISWDRWKLANLNEDPYHPLYGSEVSAYLNQAQTSASLNELRVHSSPLPSYDMRLLWSSIQESQHTGNAKTFDGNLSRGLAAIGEYWFHPQGEELLLFHQFGLYNYSKLRITDLVHRNYVYGAHSVTIKASDALTDEDESGFLVPLHYPTLKALGLAKQTQIAGASSYLVFNTYQNVTIPWWQTGVFRIILTIAALAASVIFAPAGALGAKVGILGTNASVGAYLGVSNAAAAAIVGQIVNSVAAVVVSQIVTRVSVKVFGEKAGAIIGAVASFVALNVGSHYAATGNLNVDWAKIFSSENLLSLTNSVTDAYSRWLETDTQTIFEEINRVEDEYETELEEIASASQAAGLGTTGSIDPSILVDATSPYIETRDMFLSRTLMTGTEIADLSFALVHNFTDITLELPTEIR